MSRSSLPSPALVVASLALLFALAGTGIASVAQVPPRNSVGTLQLRNSAVTAAKIKNVNVTAAKIASNAVTSAKIAANAVTGAKVADGSLQAADLEAGTIPPSQGLVRFQNGPFAIPTALTTLSSLAIPQAGNYIIWAKAYATSTATATVTCRVAAEADFDEAKTSLGDNASQTVTLIVAHIFTAAGSINFQCSTTGAASANFIKIAAMRVGTLTNTG